MRDQPEDTERPWHQGYPSHRAPVERAETRTRRIYLWTVPEVGHYSRRWKCRPSKRPAACEALTPPSARGQCFLPEPLSSVLRASGHCRCLSSTSRGGAVVGIRCIVAPKFSHKTPRVPSPPSNPPKRCPKLGPNTSGGREKMVGGRADAKLHAVTRDPLSQAVSRTPFGSQVSAEHRRLLVTKGCTQLPRR